MARYAAKTSILLKIDEGTHSYEHVLRPNDRFTVGRSRSNDLVLFGQEYPKKHVLVECGKKRSTIYLSPAMSGEICYRDSKLSFKDLIFQDVLPQKGDGHALEFSHGRNGFIEIGNYNISFVYNGNQQSKDGLSSYSWKSAVRRSVRSDLLFKTLFLFLFSLEIFLGLALRNVQLPPPEPPDIETVPKRFVKFIVDEPTPPPESQIALPGGQAETARQGQGENQRRRTSGGQGGPGDRSVKKPLGSQGLLGLIGGTGETDFSSSAVDFLVGEGLVEELDQLMNRQTLVKNRGIGRGGSGQGSGSGAGTGDGDDLDDLIAFGASGGIDDLLSDVGGVSTMDMTKKGDIAIETPRQLRGSPTAKGHRTVESVMNIILNQKGMMDYTYTKYLRTEPDLRGKISLDVTIEANGRVSDVTVVESTFPSQDFINDIIRIIRRLRFPTIPEGSITVNLPLVFNRIG